MAKAKAQTKTQKYTVVKKHTLDHKVGEVISLTDEKAANLIGKVRLQSEGTENVTTSGASKKLKEENEALKSEVEALKKAAE